LAEPNKYNWLVIPSVAVFGLGLLWVSGVFSPQRIAIHKRLIYLKQGHTIITLDVQATKGLDPEKPRGVHHAITTQRSLVLVKREFDASGRVEMVFRGELSESEGILTVDLEYEGLRQYHYFDFSEFDCVTLTPEPPQENQPATPSGSSSQNQ
jgi:hypothetical protein